MKIHLSGILTIFCFAVLVTSCDKEEIKLDPKKVILGKWELSHHGGRPVEEPAGYEEYLPDSVRISYFYDGEAPYITKYWFTDSLLHISTEYAIVGEDTTVTITVPYKYTFLSGNELELVFLMPSQISDAKYKRIN